MNVVIGITEDVIGIKTHILVAHDKYMGKFVYRESIYIYTITYTYIYIYIYINILDTWY